MDDRSVMNLKSSDRLKQEIDNEQGLILFKFQQTVTDAAATIQVNNTTATTLATVDGTNITAKASFCWEEYE